MDSGNGVLVLGRGVNDEILIGHDIVVSVAEIRVGKCRIAVSAPKGVTVLRRELVSGQRMIHRRLGQNPAHKRPACATP